MTGTSGEYSLRKAQKHGAWGSCPNSHGARLRFKENQYTKSETVGIQYMKDQRANFSEHWAESDSETKLFHTGGKEIKWDGT